MYKRLTIFGFDGLPLSSDGGVGKLHELVWRSGYRFTEQMMLADMLNYLPDDILVKVDRAAMGVSLEIRAPFLDQRLLQFAR